MRADVWWIVGAPEYELSVCIVTLRTGEVDAAYREADVVYCSTMGEVPACEIAGWCALPAGCVA
jgi:hypothetical protein